MEPDGCSTVVPLAQGSSLERIRAGVGGLWLVASEVGAERLQPNDELSDLIRILADGADQIGDAGDRRQSRFKVEKIERVLLQLRRLAAITSRDHTLDAPTEYIDG